MRRVSARQLVVTFVPAVLILAAILVMRARYGITTSAMTEDITWTAGVYPLTGFLSNFGVLLWCATASICAFAAAVLPTTEPRRVFGFLLSSALLSAYLCFDDLFLIHDDLVERYLGLSETAVFVALGIALVAYFTAFRKQIWRTDFSLLLLALGFFAISLTVDELVIELFPSGHGIHFLEDGTKWLGIVSWCSYFVRTSYQLVIGPRLHPASRASEGQDTPS